MRNRVVRHAHHSLYTLLLYYSTTLLLYYSTTLLQDLLQDHHSLYYSTLLYYSTTLLLSTLLLYYSLLYSTLRHDLKVARAQPPAAVSPRKTSSIGTGAWALPTPPRTTAPG